MTEEQGKFGNQLSLYGTFVKMLTLFMGFILATIALVSFKDAELLWRRLTLYSLLTAYALMNITFILSHIGVLKKVPGASSLCEPGTDEILTTAITLMSISIGFILKIAGLTDFEMYVWIAFSALFGAISFVLIKTAKSKKTIGRIGLVAIMLTLCIGIGITGVSTGYLLGFSDGQNTVINHIDHHKAIMLNLSSSNVLSNLALFFESKLNYTELLIWESGKLNYTTRREAHTNPIDILEYGKGACGEFSILYVSICLANDIPARIVVPEPFTPGIVDHVWAEVNPSKDNRTWIHVEVTDSCVRIKSGMSIYESPATVNNPLRYRSRNYPMVLAFQIGNTGEIQIVDRTSAYSP